MKRATRTISLCGTLLAWVSLGMMTSANGQVPGTVRSPSRAPAVIQTNPAGLLGAPSGLLTDRPDDERAIREVAEAFKRAYNAGDAKAVAALYTDDAEIIDESGDRIHGRPAIQDAYGAIFDERKGATIEITCTSLRFLGPDVAKEEGQTRVKPGGIEPATLRNYSLLFVKQGGRWMYSSVREEHASGVPHQERLKELDWMLGEWLDESSDSVIHIKCRWSDNKNFLMRDFLIHIEGRPVMTVTQRIGWDPLTKQIKSWVFDSEGGYGDALWARNGNQWTIKSTGVLPDGRIATATNVLTLTGPNAARWSSIERTVGGQRVPDHRETVMVRRPPQPQFQLGTK
jgi:uncharacterized protein (TIGR02246 family)